MKIRLWGVRGSIASPLTPAQVEEKIVCAVQIAPSQTLYLDRIRELVKSMPFYQRSTYGGNTSWVELLCSDNRRFILDMGTGLRGLGNSLMPEMFGNKGLEVTLFLSHVHWDHIQGLPFYAPLYINKETGIKNHWKFYGGNDWQRRAEVCLQGQMDPPNFPVSWPEIYKTTYKMEFAGVYDLMRFSQGYMEVTSRKLNHPNETYGYRFLDHKNNTVVAYTTDNEPFDPMEPDPRLLELAHQADVWITDCQYTKDQYNGKANVGGVPRHGWGHSYDIAVAKTAVMAKVKTVVLFHHDPVSDDHDEIRQQ